MLRIPSPWGRPRGAAPDRSSLPRPGVILGALLFGAVGLFGLAACGSDEATVRDASSLPDPAAATTELERWEARAARVTLARDDWGIPHIHGVTDADAVFGMIYAQAEDDFPRIERNLLIAQGRWAEAEGEGELWRDLRQRMFIDERAMEALREEAPEWLQALLDAWADGLNYYLHTHPEVAPRVLDRFEPWMPLAFSEGSIGGDIERVNLARLAELYAEGPEPVRVASAPERGARILASLVTPDPELEPRGSNGIAIAPRLTENGNALFLINPHTSFYFRHEAHVRSDEGLHAYGASTWGQFFIYQGFNETAGWMHTSSRADNIDEFLEEVVERDGTLYYRFGEEERPLERREVTVRYRVAQDSPEAARSAGHDPAGPPTTGPSATEPGFAERTFVVYRTHRGPVVRATDGRWVSVAMMEEPLNALIQSYQRMKAPNLEAYLETMRLHTNSSNNTLFADADGNVAYLHANFIPVRDPRFDYDEPVDGADPATDWQGVHTLEESPNAINPATGWAMCTNNWPWSAAGEASPLQQDFAPYFDRGIENARGMNALRELEGVSGWTLERLHAAAYTTHLPAFAAMVPPLVEGWDALDPGDPLREATAEAVSLLREWDFTWDVESVPTAVAVFWGTELLRGLAGRAQAAGMDATLYAAEGTTPEGRLRALVTALDRLEADFGDWRTPWGEINRFQRLTGRVQGRFEDDAPSLPVGFTSARWGSLASYGAGPQSGTARWYGTSGNSFVAVVEFGERVRAMAITAGGLNHDPASPHFNDQAELYASGGLRPVHFHPDEVAAATVRSYRPGERAGATTALRVSPEAIRDAESSVLLRIDALEGSIEVEPGTSFGAAERFTGASLAPHGRALALSATGAAHGGGWVVEIPDDAEPVPSPAAFQYGGEVELGPWSEEGRYVVFVLRGPAGDQTLRVVSLAALGSTVEEAGRMVRLPDHDDLPPESRIYEVEGWRNGLLGFAVEGARWHFDPESGEVVPDAG